MLRKKIVCHGKSAQAIDAIDAHNLTNASSPECPKTQLKLEGFRRRRGAHGRDGIMPAAAHFLHLIAESVFIRSS